MQSLSHESWFLFKGEINNSSQPILASYGFLYSPVQFQQSGPKLNWKKNETVIFTKLVSFSSVGFHNRLLELLIILKNGPPRAVTKYSRNDSSLSYFQPKQRELNAKTPFVFRLLKIRNPSPVQIRNDTNLS